MTITAKFSGKCVRCGGRLPQGSRIEWTRDGGARHLDATACAAAQVVTVAPVADLSAIVALLRAASPKLKFPKARFLAPAEAGGELRVWLAGAQASVPGSVQVKHNDTWIGRIEPDGKVRGPLADKPTFIAQLLIVGADPAAAARAYAALMCACSFCRRTLTDAGSVEVGYGPDCASAYGLPHTPKGTPVLARPVAA